MQSKQVQVLVQKWDSLKVFWRYENRSQACAHCFGDLKILQTGEHKVKLISCTFIMIAKGNKETFPIWGNIA